MGSIHGFIYRTQRTAPAQKPWSQNIILARTCKCGYRFVSMGPYQYPHFQKNEIKCLVSQLVTSRAVRPSTNPYSSLVLLVKKHDGSWMLHIDYRALNKITIKDNFQFRLSMSYWMNYLAQFFFKLDLMLGYHQIRMHNGGVEKAALWTHHEHYEFLVISFGVSNAPFRSQSLRNEVFSHLLRKFILVFFDDILFFSKNGEDHLKYVETV